MSSKTTYHLQLEKFKFGKSKYFSYIVYNNNEIKIMNETTLTVPM